MNGSAPATAAPTAATGPLRRDVRFRRLWIGQSISQTGSQVTVFALPLVALEVLDRGAPSASLLSALATLPFLLVGLPAGALVDRWPTRRVLVVADLARSVLVLLIPLAYLVGALDLWLLFVVAFGTGVLRVFFDIAYQSYLPSLVDRSRLLAGNAALELSRSGAQIAGPTLAALLLRIFALPVVILLEALTFLLSALSVARIPEPPTPARPRTTAHRNPAPDRGTPPRGLGPEIAAGLRHVWADPRLRRIAATTSVANLFTGMATALFVPFATVELDLSPASVATVFAVGNIGFLLAALLAQRLARWLGVTRTLVYGAVLMCVAGLFVPAAVAGPALALLVVARIGQGAGSTLYNLGQVSSRQAITPPELQGRMNATIRFLGWGALPVGGLLGAAGAGTVGVTPSTFIAAVGLFAALLPLGPLLRDRDLTLTDRDLTLTDRDLTLTDRDLTLTDHDRTLTDRDQHPTPTEEDDERQPPRQDRRRPPRHLERGNGAEQSG